MADHEATPVVQDIWYQGQRVLRTLVQVGIPAFLGFALVLPQIIGSLGLPVDGALYGWLLGAAGVVTAVAGALSRVMAIPAVNAWLVKVGLGSVPASAATDTSDSADALPDEVNPDPDAVSDGALVDGDGLTTDQTK